MEDLSKFMYYNRIKSEITHGIFNYTNFKSYIIYITLIYETPEVKAAIVKIINELLDNDKEFKEGIEDLSSLDWSRRKSPRLFLGKCEDLYAMLKLTRLTILDHYRSQQRIMRLSAIGRKSLLDPSINSSEITEQMIRDESMINLSISTSEFLSFRDEVRRKLGNTYEKIINDVFIEYREICRIMLNIIKDYAISINNFVHTNNSVYVDNLHYILYKHYINIINNNINNSIYYDFVITAFYNIIKLDNNSHITDLILKRYKNIIKKELKIAANIDKTRNDDLTTNVKYIEKLFSKFYKNQKQYQSIETIIEFDNYDSD